MLVKTYNQAAIENSLCECFGISKERLALLETTIKQKESLECVEKFIQEYPIKKAPEIVCFFHLSRTLKSAQDNLGRMNLFELLTTKNSFTEFFAAHDVTFRGVDEKIVLYHHGKEVSIESDLFNPYRASMLKRFGYLPNSKDFCVNGFLFKDSLYANRYAWSLLSVPETVRDIAGFLGRDDIGLDYYRNSLYYCYEYHIPLNQIIFDDASSLNLKEKENYLIKLLFERVAHYIFDDFPANDRNNCILRLGDSENLSAKYFFTREVVSQNSIRRY